MGFGVIMGVTALLRLRLERYFHEVVNRTSMFHTRPEE
jgi:hypothetical protein